MNPPTLRASEFAAWIRMQADAAPNRFLLGIAGTPGSGKSTIARQMESELDAVVVPMDGYHLTNAELDRSDMRSIKGAPATFAAAKFVDAVRALRRADADISIPDFDRDNDEPRPDQILVSARSPIVIVEGNYLLLDASPWSELRGLFDAVAHLNVDPSVRVRRLVERHVQFGKTRVEATEFVKSSDELNAVRVEAVRQRAHVIVETEQ